MPPWSRAGKIRVSALAVAVCVVVLLAASIGTGVLLRHRLPEKHLSGDSKDVIKLATALVATMAALVTALLFASTRASYEATHSQVGQLTANVVELDRLLKDYGPEGMPLRVALRQDIAAMIHTIWEQEGGPSAQDIAAEARVVSQLRQLSPGTPLQAALQARASAVSAALAQIQLVLFAHPSDAISRPFVIVLVLWLCFIFGTFAMSSEPNPTLLAVLFFSALSAAGAIYLIIELGQPFDGLMQISNAPLQNALAPLP